MLAVEVVVEHFLDAAEQNANGDWDYFYQADLFTFSADTGSNCEILQARVYSDTPKQASFIERQDKLETSPLTEAAVAYLRGTRRRRSIALGQWVTASGGLPTNARS